MAPLGSVVTVGALSETWFMTLPVSCRRPATVVSHESIDWLICDDHAGARPDPSRWVDSEEEEVQMPQGASPLGRPVGSKGEDTRRRVMSAAMQCVAEMGYARATIREIARAADMTSGSLYHYFPNKAEIVKATYIEVSEATMPRLVMAADEAEGLVDKLVAVIDEGGLIMQEYPYAVAFDRAVRAPGVDDAVLPKISDSIFAALRDIVEDVIRQAHRNGELNPEATPQGATNAVFALMRGLYDSGPSMSKGSRDTVAAVRLLLRGTLMTGGR
jgi:AcrR family transcriptional regulator